MAQQDIQISVPIIGVDIAPVAYAEQILDKGTNMTLDEVAKKSAAYGPYASVAAAHTALSTDGLNTVGTTVGISGSNNTVVEYWYQGGTAQANLVEKSSGGGGGSEQIQSDWNQTDSTKKDFIKNKPNIPDTSDYYTKSQSDDNYQRKVTGKGLSTNDYTNEEKQKVGNALVPADIAGKANASDVYTKSETYTKTEVNGLVDTPHQEYVTVDAYSNLPATGSKDTIYRVSNYNGSTSQVDASVYSQYAWNGSQYILLCVKSQIGEVFDISVYNNNAKYADLAAALNGGANIPQSLQKGGMSVKFVQSSDNNYVQFRCMPDEFTTDVAKWQGVDEKPLANSKNLVESGGVYNEITPKHSDSDFSVADEDGNNIVDFKNGHVKTKNFDSENPIIKEANSHNDLSFVDENNNSVVEFNKGHVKTKYFDSANPPVKDEFTPSDFAISDKQGNNVLEIKGGIPKTLKFDGDYFKFDKCITIKAIADAGVSQLFGEGEYGFNSATMTLHTKIGGVLTNVSELLNRNNVFKLPAYEDTLYTWNGYNFTSIGRSYLRSIPKIPYMVFNIDTNLRDISGMYENINYGSVYTMLEQVYALFDELVAEHSDYITKVDAAAEVGLTYPAYCNLNGQASGDYLATPTYRTYIYKLCDNDVYLGNTSAWNHKRKIFITGGLHGNEYISPFNIYMLAKSLCDDFLESESFFKLRGTFDFYFIPCLNGYGQYHNTRANANKVNINRNFPTPDWAIAGEDTKDSDQGNNFTGYTAGSEFETQIVIKQLERIKPDIYIDHHNYGGESHYNYCTILTNKLYPLAGMSEVYAAYTLKKAYPQWFGNNFKGLLYGPAASPRVYYYTGKTLTASNYAGWKYQDMMAFTIETAPHIKVVNGEWTGEPQVPDYSEEVLTMDEYLLRMQIEVCANAYLFLNS